MTARCILAVRCRRFACLFTAVALLSIGSSAPAVSTSHWLQSSEADFRAGTFKQTVATNLGELRLSRAVKSLMTDDPRVSAVYALAEMPDGTIYAGTGPEGVLLKYDGKSVTTAATLGHGTNIFSLLPDRDGSLLIGTGGADGRILRLAKGDAAPKEIFAAEGVQYVWAMVQAPDGKTYAATGPNGQLFELTADGKNRVLFKTDQSNLLCLLSDGKGNLYTGTDPAGLIYRVDRQTGNSFVVYDAPESEIGALAMDDTGNLYAATSEAIEPSRLEVAGPDSGETEKPGHTGEPKPSTPIPSHPPTVPQPPELPPPGGPAHPIPRTLPPATEPSASAVHGHAEFGQADYFMVDSPSTGHSKPLQVPAASDLPDEPAPDNAADAAAAHGQHGAPGQNGNEANPSGANAIYKIDTQGFVTEIFRQNEMVMSLAQQNGLLLAGTGNDGLVYQIDPGNGETTVLAKLESKVIAAVLPTKDGRVLLGTANTGNIASMGAGFADTGAYTSAVMDAKQISRWGKIRLNGTLSPHTGLTVSTRSGNIQSATDPGWSDWSAEAAAQEYLPITSPPARFLQYRLTFTSGSGADSAVVTQVRTGYQMPNLPPEITSIKVSEASGNVGAGNGAGVGAGTTPPAGPPTGGNHAADTDASHPNATRSITWEASAPNNDPLRYTLYFRDSRSAPWTLLKDKLTDPSYDWNTRNVADGRYEVKVVASDAAANPPGQGRSASRVSDVFTIDNTPPVIGDLHTDITPGSVRIRTRIVDRTSSVAALDYSLDSADDWQAELPVDMIADSPEETYDFVVSGLAAGRHQITLRAADDQGNLSYETLQLTIDKPGPKAQD
jgi:hypothetical protein